MPTDIVGKAGQTLKSAPKPTKQKARGQHNQNQPMLVIRFKKVGRKAQKTFRLIVTEKKTPPRGRPLEYLGWWNPHSKKGAFKQGRIKHWVSKGAQLSDTARAILAKHRAV
jgi:small subunit ribosomal protein S16